MTTPNPLDAPFRRLFAGFDRDVDPPTDFATRLRLRVLAAAELDDPFALRPVAAPTQEADVMPAFRSPVRPVSITASTPAPITPSSIILPPSSQTDEVGLRRRQPRWLLAAEVAVGLLLLIGAAAVVLRFAVEPDRSAPRLGSSMTAVAGPSTDPELLWERTDPDLQGTGAFSAGDDLLVRSVEDEHKTGVLWFQRYDYDFYLQALDRRTGEQRWLVPTEGFSDAHVIGDTVLTVTYGADGGQAARLAALDQTDGAERWRLGLDSPPAYVASFPELPGTAFLGSYEGQLRAVDLATGELTWTATFGSPPADDGAPYLSTTSLVLDGGHLLTLDPTGAVVELDPATGAIVRTHPAAFGLLAIVYDGRLIVTADRLITIVVGTNDAAPEEGAQQPTTSQIAAVDRSSGRQVWSQGGNGGIGVAAAVDGRLILWDYDDAPDMPGLLRALDLETGTELWNLDRPFADALISWDAPVTSDGQLVFGTQSVQSGGELVASEIVSIDSATGAEQWRYDLGRGVGMSPSLSGGMVVTSDRPGHLVAIAIPANR